MKYGRSSKLLALPVLAALVLGACGDDETTSDTKAPETTGAAGGAGSLAGICPETIAIQTDWMPEAEHGFLYQLVGAGYEIDASKAYVTGPLVDSTGADTGVKIQIRSGGAPQQFQPVTQLLYNGDALLGYVYTDEAIQFSGEFPTVAIQSGFEKNPQMIMWDPETYPDVKTIADLGKTDATIRYFSGAAYMDFLTGTGVLDKAKVDGSYNGDPSLFIADEGKAAQQGFGSAEPYLYKNELTDWGKDVAFQYINDAGWKNYAESIATKPENIEKYADCFTKLVPMIQQASIDYLNSPATANGIILDASTTFGADFGWTYTQGAADFGVATIKADGLVANGPDGMGSFDMDRVNELIALAIPIYEAQGAKPKEGLKAEDIVTNQFIDPSIKL
ncbi:MAG: ABC transporter substrate-binding protein [Ilumatobacteraceae bacterium]